MTVNANENAFFVAVSSRIAEVDSASNKQMLMRCATMLALSANTSFLEKLDVKASDLIEHKSSTEKMCIYSVKQIEHVVSAINKIASCSVYDASENVICAIRTALNFHSAKRKLTKSDIIAALDLDVKLTDDRKALIFRRQKHFSSAKRQADICMNVLRVLKIVTQVNKLEYEVNSNAATKALKLIFSK